MTDLLSTDDPGAKAIEPCAASVDARKVGLVSVWRYWRYRARDLARREWFAASTSARDAAEQLNRQLIGYPSNHNYAVCDGQLLPSLRLYLRWRRVSALYPEPLTSLL